MTLKLFFHHYIPKHYKLHNHPGCILNLLTFHKRLDQWKKESHFLDKHFNLVLCSAIMLVNWKISCFFYFFHVFASETNRDTVTINCIMCFSPAVLNFNAFIVFSTVSFRQWNIFCESWPQRCSNYTSMAFNWRYHLSCVFQFCFWQLESVSVIQQK